MQHAHEVFCMYFSSEPILIKYTRLSKDYSCHAAGLFPYFHRNIFTLSNIFSLNYDKNDLSLIKKNKTRKGQEDIRSVLFISLWFLNTKDMRSINKRN